MKKTVLFSAVMVLLASLLFSSCLSASFGMASGPEAALLKQVKKITDAGGVAAIGTGVDTNGREDLALKKAILDGRTLLAQEINLQVKNLEKNFQESLSGSSGNSELNEMFSSTTETLTKQSLTGSKTLSDPITKKEGNKVTVKVIVGIEPRSFNNAAMAEIQKTQPALYERFRASQGFAELDKKMAEFDASTPKQ